MISGVHNLSAMRFILDLNSTANFLLVTRRLQLPQIVSLSIRIIHSAAATRQYPGARLHILPIISKAYRGLIDLDLRNTESSRHDFLGWSWGLSALDLPKLQRLVVHSAPVSVDWIAIERQNSWILPSLLHLSVDPGPYSPFYDTVWPSFSRFLLTLSVRTDIYINATFWTIFPALQDLEITLSSPYDVFFDGYPPATHPIRSVVIRGAWVPNPDDSNTYPACSCLFDLTAWPSPLEWLICDDKSINGLSRTQWQQYKEKVFFYAGYTDPEVREHTMEKWVTGEDRD